MFASSHGTIPLMAAVRDNIDALKERVRTAAERSGRTPDAVRVMAVTKTQPRELVEQAYEAGIRLFGENRIGEAQEKYAGFHDDAELHMIGHLQRNKVKQALGLVACVQSVDKVETAAALERRCAATSRELDILLEMNTSGEGSKEGFRSEEELYGALEEILPMGHLHLRGLMTVAAFTDEEALLRRSFRSLAELRESVQRRFSLASFSELSMGMSHDFEIAVEEGATLIRVGSLLFGARQRT